MLTHHDPNAGHITILAFGGKWLVGFNLVRNAARTQEHLTASDEFLTAAAGALDAGHMRAFAENLFAAAELLAKADLLGLPGREILRWEEAQPHQTAAQPPRREAGEHG